MLGSIGRVSKAGSLGFGAICKFVLTMTRCLSDSEVSVNLSVNMINVELWMGIIS